MGFDNECILNIQSLAGEYFCPVCRLLVYPDEALQSQCTHLYCKPCLTYVVSTTRACPYDGYLVTEADSKPLVESNKTLVETIGKIPVHCLYHRSGCTWQGTLADCTSHCSGCAFGNSHVVCNRCGIQIMHRQVQEHAQNCPGVQGQVQQGTVTQDPSATTAMVSTASTDQNQTTVPVGAMATTGQVSNQLPNPASQSQPVQTAVQPTADQWYQQQQYQQYYQQYPGQDPYQMQYQHYYPYQQPLVPPYQQNYGQPQPQFQSQLQVHPQSQGQPQAQHQAQLQLQPQPQTQGLPQSLPQVSAPVASQSQPQMQVQQQQELQYSVQPHSQIQPPSHPPGHIQALPKSQSQPLPYPYSQSQVPQAVQTQPQQHMEMPPYQQPHPQMQHSQPQIQQPVQKYPVPQPQVHPQLQPNAPGQHPSQPQVHPHQPLATNVQSQVQNASSHAVTGYHSYTQPQPNQGIQPGAPQHAMKMHAQSGPLPQAQHPVPMKNQFPQQIPMMHSHQSPTNYPHQQQPTLFTPPVQGQSTPPLQQKPVYNPNQQTGQINQHPILQPAKQILPQQPSAQHQMSLPSHLRPQGPAHSFPRHAFPPSQGNLAMISSTQHNQSQNAGGRPVIPNHAAQIQPFAQVGNKLPVRPGKTGVLLGGTKNQVQLSSGFQSRVPEQIERQGGSFEQQTDSATGKLELKSEKAETDIKPTDVGIKQSGEDPNPVKTSGPNANALKNGDSVSKSVGKGEVAENTREASSGNKSCDTIPAVQNNSNEHSALEGSEIKDVSLLKTEAKNVSQSETDKLRNNDKPTTRPTGADNQAPAASQTHGSQGPVGIAQPSHLAPLTDHGKHHQQMTNYGHGGTQQRSSSMLASQLPHPAGPNDPLSSGHSSNLSRNDGYARDPYLGQPPSSDIQFGTLGKSFPPQSLGPPGPYDQGQEPPFHAGASNFSRIGGQQFGAPPLGDMHGGIATNLPPHGPDGLGLQDERFNSFQIPGRENFGRREFEVDLKKFPRPLLEAEPVSKFGKHPLGPHEAGKRPVGLHDDAIKKSGATLHPGYLGVGPGYGRHHLYGMAPRSPGSEYFEMPTYKFAPLTGGLVSKAGMDDFDGRAAHRFGESAFHDRGFPHLPGHLHTDEFEGFGSFRMGEYPRSGDFTGQDEFSDHFHRGEHFGPLNFSRRGPHMRAVELGGSRSFDSFESFSKGDRSGHLQPGEPGFRSSFSLPGFPNDPGFLPGDIRSFDNLRRRKVTSMGWCRICSVDCETVEGLDLHSQTREHQKMAMDMVKSIKQNVKKQKLIRAGHSSVEYGNKSQKTGF